MKLVDRNFSISPAGLWNLFLSVVGYRIATPVTELKVFQTRFGESGYYVCPRCAVTMEREFMPFCDRCGQRLDWKGYKKAKITYQKTRKNQI